MESSEVTAEVCSMAAIGKRIEDVLIVDDDDNIRMIVEMSLEGLSDWKLRQARNGREALARIKELRPDLILLDVMMPDVTGVMLYEQIKDEYGSDAPSVIFMTAKVQTHEVESYVAMGAIGVIMKPFDPMTLPDQIEMLLGLG